MNNFLFVHIHTACTLGLQRSEEDIDFPGTGIVDAYESLWWCWEQNSRSSARVVRNVNHFTISTYPTILIFAASLSCISSYI